MLTFYVLVTAFLALATALPFLSVSHGIVRVGDFPRQQFLVLAAILTALSVPLAEGTTWRAVQLVLIAVAAVQAWHVVRFTPLVKKQSAGFNPSTDRGEAIRVVSSNVKMANKRHGELARAIAAENPDIVVLMEVDDVWRNGLTALLDAFPHRIEQPQDNTYGMILASKFALSDVSVEDLLTDKVPSIIATVTTPKGQPFRLYSIHPEPPVPHRGTEGRDGETALVALKVREETLPVIVTGDLNDVAWSVTTSRFRKISRLLDPRIGRQIFSTFDARFPLMRWPLDHLFHSPEFRLKDMKRLAAAGSDHFPVLFELVLCRDEKAESTSEQADAEDMAEAKTVIRAAKARDDEAIGTDWEK